MATFRKVYWTQDEFNRVAALFGPEYEKAEHTMRGLRESLIFAQAILPPHRQRPVDGPASSVYNLRSQLLAVCAEQKKSREQEFQQNLGLLVASASAQVMKKPSPVTVQVLGQRDNPLKGLPAAGEKLVAIASATPPPATEDIPMSPMSKIVAQVVEKTLRATLPALLQEMEARFDERLSIALAQQKKELFDFWGGPVEGVSIPPPAEPAPEPAPVVAHASPSDQLGFKSLDAVPAKKPRVLVFGALDSQRRAYQEALPGCDIEVSKDKFKVEHLGGYDLVIVLRDFVPADLRRIIEKNGKDVRLVTGAVAKTVDQIKQALHH